MAGDWMQIDLDLPEKPEVLRLCDATGLGSFAVVGRLVAFWRWVERMGVDGRIKNATPQVVSAVVADSSAFVDMLVTVKWIAFDDAGATIPDWERRFSKAAKQRMEDAKRQQARRKADARPKKPDKTRTKTDEPRTNLGTKEELELKKKIHPPPTPSTPTEGGGDSALVQSWQEVEEDLLGCGLAAAREAVDAIRANGCTVDDANNVIDFWRFSTPAWGAGALYQRLLNMRPGQDPSSLWPGTSSQFAKAESRRSSDASHERIVSQRLEGERTREAELAVREKREYEFGQKLDAMKRDQILVLIRKAFPTAAELMVKRLPEKGKTTGTLRDGLLEHLESESARSLGLELKRIGS